MRQRIGVDALGGQGVFDASEMLPVAVIKEQQFAVRAGELRRDAKSKVLKETEHVTAPARSNCGGAERVLEDQIPTDDPGEDLAQGGVAVSIGGTRDRDQ